MSLSRYDFHGLSGKDPNVSFPERETKIWSRQNRQSDTNEDHMGTEEEIGAM